MRVFRNLTRAFIPLLSVWPVYAQFDTTLQPSTVDAFEQYVHKVEQELAARWHGQQPFLSLDQNASERAQVLAGDLFIEPGTPDNPIAISNGLIHDWVGDVFFPNTSVQKVLGILQDFNFTARSIRALFVPD